MDIPVDPPALLAFLLALARSSAFIAVAPPFNSRAIPTQVKVVLAASLALFSTPMLKTDGLSLEWLPFMNAVLTQVMTGLVLGFITFLLFSSVQAAGQMIDIFGGFTVAPAFDPLMNVQSSTIGRVYSVLAITMLFAINGHLLLVRGFLMTFDVVPISGLSMASISDLFTRNLAVFFLSAVQIAGPILGALFLAEVVLGLLARAAPMMNVFALAFPFKILLTLMLLGVTLPLVTRAVSTLVNEALIQGITAIGG